MPNSWWSRMIRSQALQRTTPSSAGIGPSSTRRARNALCSFVSLPGYTLLMILSGPCSLNRITQSRSVCRSMPPHLCGFLPCGAVEHLELPTTTRLRCILYPLRDLPNVTAPIAVRTAMARPMANDPPLPP